MQLVDAIEGLSLLLPQTGTGTERRTLWGLGVLVHVPEESIGVVETIIGLIGVQTGVNGRKGSPGSEFTGEFEKVT